MTAPSTDNQIGPATFTWRKQPYAEQNAVLSVNRIDGTSRKRPIFIKSFRRSDDAPG
jgi:hypothetical protein